MIERSKFTKPVQVFVIILYIAVQAQEQTTTLSLDVRILVETIYAAAHIVNSCTIIQMQHMRHDQPAINLRNLVQFHIEHVSYTGNNC